MGSFLFSILKTLLSVRFLANVSPKNCESLSTRGGSRTHTPLRAQDFESSASAIPPLWQVFGSTNPEMYRTDPGFGKPQFDQFATLLAELHQLVTLLRLALQCFAGSARVLTTPPTEEIDPTRGGAPMTGSACRPPIGKKKATEGCSVQLKTAVARGDWE